MSALFDVSDGAVVLHVHAQPGAGRTEVVGRHGDAVKIKVAAPPEGGRANEALAAVLADAFGLKAAQVTLVSGASNRAKRFRLADLDPDGFDDRLDDVLEQAAKRPGRR